MLKYAGKNYKVAGGLLLFKGAPYNVVPCRCSYGAEFDLTFACMVSDGFTVGYIKYHSIEDFVGDWEVAECCDS